MRTSGGRNRGAKVKAHPVNAYQAATGLFDHIKTARKTKPGVKGDTTSPETFRSGAPSELATRSMLGI
jgi:hypothetical protein